MNVNFEGKFLPLNKYLSTEQYNYFYSLLLGTVLQQFIRHSTCGEGTALNSDRNPFWT